VLIPYRLVGKPRRSSHHVSNQSFVTHFKGSTLEVRRERLCRNIGKKLPLRST